MQLKFSSYENEYLKRKQWKWYSWFKVIYLLRNYKYGDKYILSLSDMIKKNKNL